MPKVNVVESTIINAPVSKVYQTVNDLGHWTSWSPWLIMEPGAKVNVTPDNKHYEWEGKRVGKGNMQITDEKADEYVNYDLTFLTPFKSHAKVRFEVKPNGDATETRWYMDSSLPWFMFWMKKMMSSFISLDYKRGLALLKDYVEDGEVHSKLDFKGPASYPGCKYIGIKNEATLDSLGTQMTADFEKLGTFMQDHSDIVADKAFSIYHKWDMVKGFARYTSGIPVKSIPASLPTGITSGEILATPVYTLKHTGHYAHLGNAWGTLYSMARNKEIKQNKKIDPFETYLNMPGEVDENELITEVHFPVK